MGRATYYILCIFIFNSSVFVYCQEFVGDYCTASSTGAPGQCEIITNCPSALQDLGRGIIPKICGYQGIESVVCCVGATSNVKPTPETPKAIIPTATPTTAKHITLRPTTTPVPVPITQPATLRVGDKSRAKCKEYVKYVYQYVTLGGPPTADCVIEDIPLIVGGKKAKAREFPHMALIGFQDENNEKLWQCGGSLISEQFVLTAGHCLYTKPYGSPKYIRLGELVLYTNTDDADPQDFNIAEIFRYPEYIPPSRYNDIALLRMDRKAKLNPYVRPACLETNPTLNVARKPIASGWGQVGWSEGKSDALQKVTLEYFNHMECNASYRSEIGRRMSNGIVEETQICAGSHDESKDTCQGDSGGPLQIGSKEEFCMYKIVGVTSFGKGCGAIKIPAIYTRVSSYIKWIEDIVWP